MKKLQNDMFEAIHADMMRHVLEPIEDDLPDGTVDFAARLEGMQRRIERAVAALPFAERPAFYLEKARSHLAWARANKAPDILIARLEAWNARLARSARSA